jgi:hypothetical protein
MITPQEGSPVPPASPTAGRERIGTDQLRAWMEGRRKIRRRIKAAVLSVLVTGLLIVAVIWGIFHEQLMAISHLSGRGFRVDWNLNAGNLARGGENSVTFPIRSFRPPHHITASDLESIASLRHVISLDLSTIPLLDDMLGFLPRLTDLNELYLHRLKDPGQPFGRPEGSERALSDRCLEYVRDLKQLDALSVSYNRITDEGLKQLDGLRSLKTLELAYTLVTDAGLRSLANLQELETLDLEGTRITDAGLASLKGLKGLKLLRLDKTRVTEEGVVRFQSSRPGVEVVRESVGNIIY